MRRLGIALFLSLVLAALMVIAAGCGEGIDAGSEVDGKPVVINFWQPG